MGNSIKVGSKVVRANRPDDGTGRVDEIIRGQAYVFWPMTQTESWIAVENLKPYN